jgi:hypothetical protein
MKEIARVAVRAGLVSPEMLAEFQRWTFLPANLEADPPPMTAGAAIQQLQRALEEEQVVLVPETDLDALQQYLKTMRMGIIRLVSTKEDPEFDVPVMYGVLTNGDFIIPYGSENIEELLTNGLTYLVVDGMAFFFSSIRELYFGETKTFLACRVQVRVKEESHGLAEPDISTAH